MPCYSELNLAARGVMERADQRGSVLVEAMLVLPLLCMFAAAIVQFGYIYSVQIGLQHAAFAAARVATLGSGRTSAEVCEAARVSAVGLVDSTLLGCSTQPSVLPVAPDTAVTVALSYPMPLLFGESFLATSELVTLRAQTTMQ